jgi:hypothetical protein
MRERKIQKFLIDMDFVSDKSINSSENEIKCIRLGREYLFQRNFFEWAEKITNLSQDCRYSNMENVTSQALV